MSGVVTAITVASAAYSIYSGQQQASAQKQAQAQARNEALKQEKSADEAMNRANQKTADSNALLDAAKQAGKSGASGTMLTGPAGVDPDALKLSKSTLLGG